MNLTQRVRTAARPALIHLGISALVAALAALLVFAVWYPYPYRSISGGRELFTLLISVDVVIGPALTFVVFNPRKPHTELFRDLLLIALVQLSALAYGLYSVHAARPVFLSYEGNRFRVVSAAEIDPDTLSEAKHGFGSLSQLGPITIAARLAQATDADYLASIKMSMDGLHPSLRPSRWEPYEGHRDEVRAAAKPIGELRQRRSDQAALIDAAVAEAGVPAEQLAYLPLQSRTHADWIVLIDRGTGDPRAFAPVDGW